MKKQAGFLFVFSFTSFLLVFVFGMALSPLKKVLEDPEVLRNLDLFHSHFDQLCWLGSSALAAALYCLDDRYQGTIRPVRVFTVSYAAGTFLFSFAFLARAAGMALDANVLKKGVFMAMISTGGLFEFIALICGIYMARGLFSARGALLGV